MCDMRSAHLAVTQAALTVEGKIANLDVVYAGSHLTRDVDTQQDYSDYSLFYDIVYGYVLYNDNGDLFPDTVSSNT